MIGGVAFALACALVALFVFGGLYVGMQRLD